MLLFVAQLAGSLPVPLRLIFYRFGRHGWRSAGQGAPDSGGPMFAPVLLVGSAGSL